MSFSGQRVRHSKREPLCDHGLTTRDAEGLHRRIGCCRYAHFRIFCPSLLFECFVEMHIKRKYYVLVIIPGIFNSWIFGTRIRRVNFVSDGTTTTCRPECDETNGRNDVSEIGDERRMVQNVSYFCDYSC